MWPKLTIRQRIKRWQREREWLCAVRAARRAREEMLFSDRLHFDRAFRPAAGVGAVIAYPDALYHATMFDFERALHQVRQEQLMRRHRPVTPKVDPDK